MKLMLLPPPYENMSDRCQHTHCRGATNQDMSTRDHSPTTSKPLRRSGVVEAGSLAVQLHVLRIDTRTVHLVPS